MIKVVFSLVLKIISNLIKFNRYGFYRIQGSTYVTEDRNIGNLMLAVDALAYTEWFAKSVRYIRAFKIEDWSDLTETVKIKASLYKKR